VRTAQSRASTAAAAQDAVRSALSARGSPRRRPRCRPIRRERSSTAPCSSPDTQAGGTNATAYDPYSLLRSLEDLFALKPLARTATASSFAPTVLAGAYVTPPGDG